MIVTTRIAGVDCQYCEDGVEHEHVSRDELDAALMTARATLAPGSGAIGIERLLARALLAVAAECGEWKLRASQHGCDVEHGDPECG